MQKEKINRRNKGITLIALIITIIVMLILVGVSVTVALDGGLFSTAKTATEGTEVATESELLLSAAIGALNNNGKVDLTKLASNLPDGFEPIGTGGAYKNTKSGNKYVVSENAAVTYTEGTEEFLEITATNYGDPITYSGGASEVTDWKVFYKDSTHLYIIASDVVENEKLPTGLKMGIADSETYTYVAYWPDGYTSTNAKTDITPAIANKWKLGWVSAATETTAANPNAKATADLLNVEAWTTQFGKASKGIEAIGGPTLEMFVASWNAKGYTKLYTAYDENGYYVSTDENPTPEPASTFVNLGDDKSKDISNLYFIESGASDEGWFEAYWISSPSSTYSNQLYQFYLYQPSLNTYNTNEHSFVCSAVRPVVAVPNSLITTNADGSLKVVEE